MRWAWVLSFALLIGCVERPAPGWKVVGLEDSVRDSTEGMIALRDESGRLLFARSTAEVMGDVPEFDSAIAYRGGWLLARLSGDGERARAAMNWFRGPDGDVVELDTHFAGFATTDEGIYRLTSDCNYHRSTHAITQIDFARDLESDALETLGPWNRLCARSIAVDDQGRIWLVGSLHSILATQDNLWDVVMVVDAGRPRVVHRLRGPGHEELGFQARTQLTIVDEVLYLSAARDRDPDHADGRRQGIRRLIQTGEGLEEAKVVPSDFRVRNRRLRTNADHEKLLALGSMGVQTDYADRFDIYPYHQPLDAIIDRLVEVVKPGDTVSLTLVDAGACPIDEALGRLPAGVTVDFVWLTEANCEDAFFQRFGHLHQPD